MLRGITIINNPDDQGTQLISTGYDPDTIEGMQFTAAVLRMYVAKMEKELARAEIMAELSEEQDDQADGGISESRLGQEPARRPESIPEERHVA